MENAFSSPISIIEGPPGTGKTQTILNIAANAVRQGKSVAIVSNNNSATMNVVEKLERKDLSFLTAFLGSAKNKSTFLEEQSGSYPNMMCWNLTDEEKMNLEKEITQLSLELNSMLSYKNRIAKINQDLLALEPEQHYFNKYYAGKQKPLIDLNHLSQIPSEKLLSLWLECEHNGDKKFSLLKKILLFFQHGKVIFSLLNLRPEDAIPFLQSMYYKKKEDELKAEKKILNERLENYKFDSKMSELSRKSMRLFKGELANRYNYRQPRYIFSKQVFQKNATGFNKEYPIILSTTYSIKGTLSTDHVYDYLIVDEASQVDLATGVLAFSCAKNIIIVGDQNQLPNVLTAEDMKTASEIWERYDFDEKYKFPKHSMLSSAAEIWKDAPSVLLKEHYRCHPKIATFFNQKFYNGQLMIMTENGNEKDVLTMYKTAPGNHARGHINQRQIDVVQQEILPVLKEKGFEDIGIITPYRKQVQAIRNQLGEDYEVATVHKYQGREKEAIILTSVDNQIGEFVDDPNMLNVAVSRAVKSLSVVISDDEQNKQTNYGDLANYIEYNNLKIVDSKISSVFDLLYKGYHHQRLEYLKKHKRISEYESENLAYSIIESVLNQPRYSTIGCVVHSSMATLIRDTSLLTSEESRYAGSLLTHIDFLLFNTMDKQPVLAIEIDGTAYHQEGSKQFERDMLKNNILEKYHIPLLRIKTTESNIKQKIEEKLKFIFSL